jgi:hypothetical protein
MIKTLGKKTWNGLTAGMKNAGGGMWAFIKRIPSRPVGVALTVTMPLLVVVWHMVILAQRPAHLGQITTELSSVRGFFSGPVPNSAGTQLLFAKATENGMGIYFCDPAGKQRKLLYEKIITGASWSSKVATAAPLLCWSTDDNYFAYAHPGQIVVCDGKTGAAVATVPVAGAAYVVTSGAWLSPQSLVFADNNALYEIHQGEGKWSQAQHFENFGLGRQTISGLTAFDAHSVVWQQGGMIWFCGENSGAPEKIWESSTNTLLDFSFPPGADRFLVHCTDRQGEFLADFYPAQLSRTPRVENFTRLRPGYQRRHITSFADGTGYAFDEIDNEEVPGATLIISYGHSPEPIQSKWLGLVRGVAFSRDEIFVISSRNGEPDGIWKHGLASGSADWECVVPNVEKPFAYAVACPVTLNEITNAAGEKLAYSMYSPGNLPGQKKHPLVIASLGSGEMRGLWNVNLEAFGNAGAYVACIERYGRPYPQWANDALTIYEYLSKRTDIDTNNVFLYASSAGADTINGLLEKGSGSWRGAILFNALPLPPSSFGRTRFFIVCGGADHFFGKNAAKAPRQFQDQAAEIGDLVTLLINPDSAHGATSLAVTKQRMAESLIFLREP